MTTVTHPLAGAALRLAAARWHVLALHKDGKAPAVPRGVKDATRDPLQITRWWRQRAFNIGIATGEVSGLTVVDVDSAEAAEHVATIAAAHGGMPRTVISRTPHGHHLYFQYVPGTSNRVRIDGLDIDVRSDGGYVVAPPSRLSVNERYTWLRSPWTTQVAQMPGWLREQLQPRKPSQRTAPAQLGFIAPAARYGLGALRREADQLSGIAVGARNDALNRSAFRMGSLIDPCGLSEADVTCQLVAACKINGLLDDDGLRAVENTIASGLRAGRAKPRRVPEATE